MLLSSVAGRLTDARGAALDFRGAISCCGGGYGWPLYDEAWVEFVRARRANFLHMRLGPFLTGPDGEPDWAAVGGGYPEVGGKADLSRWNEAFWARVRALIAYARDRGLYVEVDIADGWALKHCRAGGNPGYSAWLAVFNVQGEDWCGSAAQGAIAPGSAHERWVRKVVAETGRFDNVIYQDGNEIGLVAGYRVAWTATMQGLVRDEERAHRFPRHLFGTQAQRAEATAAVEVDYLEFHGDPLDATACLGKPCLVNEYNPDPPLTPAALHQRYCAARAARTYYWYWRHEQSVQDMERTLSRIAGGCP